MKLNDAVASTALVPAESEDLPPKVRERLFGARPIKETGEIEITVRIHAQYAPALRSAIDELSTRIGGRLEGSYEYATQDALTEGAIAVGALRRAVNAKIPRGNPHWRTR